MRIDELLRRSVAKLKPIFNYVPPETVVRRALRGIENNIRTANYTDYSVRDAIMSGDRVDEDRVTRNYLVAESGGIDKLQKGYVGSKRFKELCSIVQVAAADGETKENPLLELETQDLIDELVRRKFEGDRNEEAKREDLGAGDYTATAPDGATCPFMD